VIAGAGSALAQHGTVLDEPTRLMLARFVETKAREMSNLVSNVLDLMRFESGHMVSRSDWQTVDDLAGTALNHLESKLAGHPLDVRALQDLPPPGVGQRHSHRANFAAPRAARSRHIAAKAVAHASNSHCPRSRSPRSLSESCCAYRGRPCRHLLCDPFAYIVPAMRAKRSHKICSPGSPS
jgi:hypothetical protein